MLPAVTLVLWTAVLGPVLYIIYISASWSLDAYQRNKVIGQFPSEPRHWLWGHLHLFPGPNEAGLAMMRSRTVMFPRTQLAYRGPWMAVLLIRHPEPIRKVVNTSGPTEAGLAFLRERMVMFPKIQVMWRGPSYPILLLKHPDTIGSIIQTSGPNEAGLAFLRARTAQFPKTELVWRGPAFPILLVKHPECVGSIVQTSGPKEEGLAAHRQWTKIMPRTMVFFKGPFSCKVFVHHPETVGKIMQTAGPNEAGLAFMRSRAELFPMTQVVWRGPLSTILLVKHPDSIRRIILTSEPKPLGLGVYTFGIPWLGDGLLISGGKKWARNRKLLTPAFHFDILRPYMDVNNRSTDIMLGKLEKAAVSGESMEVFNNVSLLTLDIIMRCAFSYDNDCQVVGESHPYVQAVGELGDLWVTRSLQPWVYSDLLYYLTSNGRKFKKHCDFVHSVSEEIIAKRKQTIKEEGPAALKKGRYLDFLDILLTARDEDGIGLSDGDIRNEVDTFMFEGHDTTASSISWMLYSMACHPEIQKKCQQEIDDLLKGRDSDEILWDDLPKLRYLTMCIKESMRLHCPVPFIERETTKPLEIDGISVPIGTIIGIQIYNLHHNPIVWDEPMEYQPDRFLPDAMAKMDNFAFIPFSAGPRNCIGQNFAMHEQKSVIARILHRFSFELDPDHPVEKKIGVVMKTKDGMRLRIKHRT